MKATDDQIRMYDMLAKKKGMTPNLESFAQKSQEKAAKIINDLTGTVQEGMAMNRAERRRVQKDELKKEKTYNLTERQIKARVNVLLEIEKDKMLDKVMMGSIQNSLAVTIKVLHEEYEMGSVRLQRFMNHYNDTFNKIMTGEEDLEQIIKDALTKYDINLYEMNQETDQEEE